MANSKVGNDKKMGKPNLNKKQIDNQKNQNKKVEKKKPVNTTIKTINTKEKKPIYFPTKNKQFDKYDYTDKSYLNRKRKKSNLKSCANRNKIKKINDTNNTNNEVNKKKELNKTNNTTNIATIKQSDHNKADETNNKIRKSKLSNPDDFNNKSKSKKFSKYINKNKTKDSKINKKKENLNTNNEKKTDISKEDKNSKIGKNPIKIKNSVIKPNRFIHSEKTCEKKENKNLNKKKNNISICSVNNNFGDNAINEKLKTNEKKKINATIDTINSNISTINKSNENDYKDLNKVLKRCKSYISINHSNEDNHTNYLVNTFINENLINNLSSLQYKKRLSHLNYKEKINKTLKYKRHMKQRKIYCLCPFHLKMGFFKDISLENSQLLQNIEEEKVKYIVFDENKLKEINENNLEIEKIKKKQFILDSIKETKIAINPIKFNYYNIDKSNFSIINKCANKSNNSSLSKSTENFSFISNSCADTVASDLPKNPKGLQNFALNCYMNSLLQCFYHIKGLRRDFISPLKYDKKEQKVCYTLSEVMEGLTLGKKNSYSCNNFKEVLGDINSLFSGSKGADVTDLYRTVVDSIIDEIPYEYKEDEDYENKKESYEEAKKEVDPNNPINRELNFFYETVYLCPKGNKIYSVQNDSSIILELMKISKNIKGRLDIYKCLDYNFRVIQNNEFYCSKCNCTHKNKSQDRLLSLPNVLTIILNRGKGKQFVDNVDFDEIINIKKYVDDSFIDPDKKNFNYRLIGVSTHIGSSSNSGHYIAYCYRENEKKYYCFNDTRVNPVKFSDIKNDDEPYILFYGHTEENIENAKLK